MLHRTWPYGTTKRARVLQATKAGAGRVTVIMLVDEDSEGHILVERPGQTTGAQAGDVGTLVFTRGGPMGGYFRFTRDETAAARTDDRPRPEDDQQHRDADASLKGGYVD